jgi:aryl-alcohol dehydrogenase-like predicted oxidoreductase
MQRRAYGNTGQELSIIGFGGIVVAQTEQSEADRLVAEAVDRGVNYFDVAPSYGDAEERLGPALEPYRDGVFLACKTGCRDRAGSQAELERSLRRLRTDHFDLYQCHGVCGMEDVEKILAPGGALETFAAARERGLVRYLGFSAHSAEAALALMDAFPFHSVLFPVNFASYYQGGFGAQILAHAAEKGVARMALKGMARTNWAEGAARPYPKCWYEPLTDREQAVLALRWTLSQPITAAVPPGEAPLFRMALDIAEQFQPLSDEEIARVQEMAAALDPLFRAA